MTVDMDDTSLARAFLDNAKPFSKAELLNKFNAANLNADELKLARDSVQEMVNYINDMYLVRRKIAWAVYGDVIRDIQGILNVKLQDLA